MRNRILVACVGVPVILVVLYVLPAPFTPALIAVLSAVGTYEALHAIGMNHPRIALYTAIVALAIPFWVYFGEPRQWGLLVLLVYLLAVFLEAFASHLRVKMDRVGAGFFFAFVISYCLSSVVRVGALELRTSYIFLPILIPFVVDAGAMLVGMFLGKHPLTPHLPPKRRWRGSVGGLVVGGGHRHPVRGGLPLYYQGRGQLLLPGGLRHPGRRHHPGGGPGFLLRQAQPENQGLRPCLSRPRGCWTALTA